MREYSSALLRQSETKIVNKCDPSSLTSARSATWRVRATIIATNGRNMAADWNTASCLVGMVVGGPRGGRLRQDHAYDKCNLVNICLRSSCLFGVWWVKNEYPISSARVVVVVIVWPVMRYKKMAAPSSHTEGEESKNYFNLINK